MYFIGRSVCGTLVFVGGLIALNNGPDRADPWSGVAVAASNTVNAGGTSEDGEIWVTAQNTNELKILLGMGGIETIVLPAGTAPHTISFSPDGSYAYVSNIGDGDLLVVRADDRQIAIVDVPTMTLVGTLPTAGSVSGCGLVNSNDGRTIFLHSAGSTGHFYRLDTWTDTLYEDTSYGPIGIDLHALVVSANEKTAYITARGAADEIKVLISMEPM